MTREEVADLINKELYGAYPLDYDAIARNRAAMDSYVSKLLESFNRNGFVYSDVRDGIRKYSEGEEGKWKPSLNDLVRYSRLEKNMRERREGVGRRRISTFEEDLYDIYLSEMKKEPSKRNEWLIRQCLPAAELLNDPEAYHRKYGASREEYERF